MIAAAWALAATEASARAAAPTLVSLEYEIAPGAEGCPDADQFRASVRGQLGYDPFRATAERRVAVQIARKEPGFDGRIRWSDEGGRWVGDRRLSSRHPACNEIATIVAFSVAVQIQLLAALAPATPADPLTAPSAPAPPPSPPAAPAASPAANATPREGPAEAAPKAVAVPVTPAARASWLVVSVGAGASLALGIAPQTTGIGRLFASGRVGHLSLELAGDAALPVTQQDAGGRGFTLDRFAAEVAACGQAAALAACVTGTVSRMQAHGFGVDMREAPAGWFSQVGARIAASHDFLGRYFAAARVDGLIMTARGNVTLNDSVVWTTPRVGAVLGLDFGARFF